VWAVHSGEVRGEVGTRPRMCYVGWAVWVHGVSAIICYVYVIWLDLRYHLMFEGNYMYISNKVVLDKYIHSNLVYL